MSVSLRSLGKRFGPQRVLEGITFDVAEGEFVALVGPSGCGKSTLLRIVAGLEDASEGDLLIDGRRVNDLRPQERNVAMVFQSYALFPHLSTRENIAYGPKVRGEAPARVEGAVATAARTLGLDALLDRMPRALSGGQRQRVAMGRALVREPAVFLFDEPLSNLDAALRVHMRAEIRALHRQVGRSALYVTHDQTEAMTMADRVVVLRAGRVEQVGAPLDLYDRPANAFVAGFIGSPAMSMLPGVAGAGGVRLADGAWLPLARVLPHGPVTVGIRPEALRRDPDGSIALAAEVVEATGAETHVVGRAAGVPARALFRDRRRPAVGEVLRLAASEADLHVFDANGDRL
jgi:multiple sugar transport system ATP-binding protein